MRISNKFLGAGGALIATPALAHVGDHGASGPAHFLAQHGLATAIVATLAIAGTALFLFLKNRA